MTLLPFMDSRLGRATMRAFLGACVTMALLNTPAVQAQSADAVGVIYAPTLDVEGRALTLNGTGVADVISRANTGAATTWYLRVRYYSGGTGATAGKYTLQVSH